MPCSKSRSPSGVPPMRQSSQPAQPGVGLQLQPFSGGSFLESTWSPFPRFATQLEHPDTVPPTCGRAKMACSVAKACPKRDEGLRPGVRRTPLSNPHWAILSHSLPRDLHRKVFGSCRCRTRDVAREGRRCFSPCACGHSACSIDQGYACARMHGRGTWPLLPPGFQKPGLPSTHTQATPTHQLAFASRCGHGSPGVPAGPPSKKKKTRSFGEMQNCK